MRWRWTKLWVCVFSMLIGYSGCATTNSTSPRANFSDCGGARNKLSVPSTLKKICILPIKVEISELNAGGTTEEVPEWSAEGKKIVKQCLYEHCKSKLGIEIVPLDGLSEENKQLLNQYRALYEVVVRNQNYIQHIPAWDHLKGGVAGLGNGMAGFKEQLGADAILFVSGYDFHSTAGRKTAMVIYAALTGAVMPMGYCVLNTGLVELDTGNIVWTHTNGNPQYSLKNEVQVNELIVKSFSNFPTVAGGGDENERIQ